MENATTSPRYSCIECVIVFRNIKYDCFMKAKQRGYVLFYKVYGSILDQIFNYAKAIYEPRSKLS